MSKGKLKVHAPHYRYPTDGLCDLWKPGTETARGHPVAKPGDTIDCRSCLSALLGHPQYANKLIRNGYLFARLTAPPRRGRRAHPKQLNFGDLLDDQADNR